MNKNELIKDIDATLYKKICEQAIEYAVNTGTQNNFTDGFDSTIAHDLSFKLWELDLPASQLINICFELYEEMPCYAYLMYLAMEFKDFSDYERNMVIDRFYYYLSKDNPILSKPIEYSLWCDYFECNEFSELVWEDLLYRDITNEIVILKLLEASGPISFSCKEKLYKKIINNKNLHYGIFISLQYSKQDVYGQINETQAREILDILEIDKSSNEFQKLLSSLG